MKFKVIVDKLPENCLECKFKVVMLGKLGVIRRCIPMEKDLDFPIPDKRPDWCPLVVEPKLTNFSAKGVEVTQDGKVIFTGNIIYNEQTGDLEFIESDPQ